MYYYASLDGELRRFNRIAWLEWLKRWKETGRMPSIDRFSKHIGFLEGSDMSGWNSGDVELFLNNALEDRKKKSHG